jgi:pimeloyl-ACP methyl ester carboxylesterase
MASGPTSHTYFSQRLRLHYVDWGNETAPPLLMIHGGRDHCRNWDWVAERLQDRYHVIAPDLRGHGDSAWSIGASYGETNWVYDIAQLVHQRITAPVTILAHSLGGSIALLYAGVFPETVKKVIAIEGLGPAPNIEEKFRIPIEDRLRGWIETRRANSGRVARKYPTLEAAIARMQEENTHLSEEQARHLTIHGALQNEDGSYSWKFDNYIRLVGGPGGLSREEQFRLWSRISCPVLLVRGTESWASDPELDGRIKHFQNAKLLNIEGAGHWVHHDKLDVFMQGIHAFLKE